MMTSRDDGYDDTISGLLRRRAEPFGEAERLRDRIAEIRNDTEALDRTPSRSATNARTTTSLLRRFTAVPSSFALGFPRISPGRLRSPPR